MYSFDSDTVLLTDNPLLIKAARRNTDFEVPTSLISAAKANLYYTSEDKAGLDIRTSVNKIGEIINLSQELNTKLWDMLHAGYAKDSPEIRDLYKDIAQLDIMSGCEIDKAKKVLPIDNAVELRKLKEKYRERDELGRKVRPNFFAPLARSKGYYDTKRINYKRHHTSMDYVQHTLCKFALTIREPRGTTYLPLSAILDDGFSARTASSRQVKRCIQLVRSCQTAVRAQWRDGLVPSNIKYERVCDLKNECVREITSMITTEPSARSLLLAIEHDENRDVRQFLFDVLFATPNAALIAAIRNSVYPIPMLVEDENGDICLYDWRFRLQKTPI